MLPTLAYIVVVQNSWLILGLQKKKKKKKKRKKKPTLKNLERGGGVGG